MGMVMAAKEFKITPKDIWVAKKFMGAVSMTDKVYNIRIQSPFVLTPSEVKSKLGIGFRVISTEVEKEVICPIIADTTAAMDAIIKTGYRALARANHPDFGGNPEVMVILNRTKKELEQLLAELKG